LQLREIAAQRLELGWELAHRSLELADCDIGSLEL
jgi:hypothetical protein